VGHIKQIRENLFVTLRIIF